MILLADEVLDGRPDQQSFAAIDVTVRRNGYGRQVDSFEADLDVTGLVDGPFHAVFIRARRSSSPPSPAWRCWPATPTAGRSSSARATCGRRRSIRR